MIPHRVLSKGKKIADGATIYGVPFSALTHEEAIALAAYGFYIHQREQQNNMRQSDMCMKEFFESNRR